MTKHVRYLEAGLSPEQEWECMLKGFKNPLNLQAFMVEVRKSWQI